MVKTKNIPFFRSVKKPDLSKLRIKCISQTFVYIRVLSKQIKKCTEFLNKCVLLDV